MSNEMLFYVLGLKFGMGYLKFLKKDRKKLLKEKNAMLLDILQTEDCSIDLDTIIMIMVYSFIFTLILSLLLSRIVFNYCKIYVLI